MGAGEAGAMIVQSMRRTRQNSGIVGFVEDVHTDHTPELAGLRALAVGGS